MHYIIGVLLLVLGSLGYLYREEIISHGETKALAEQLKSDQEALRNSINEMAIQQAKISDENLKSTLELRETKRQLDTLRGREAAYIAKPKLVEKLINKDFKKDELELACLTGDKTACQ